MVFGVFDGLHEGHRFFLQSAHHSGELIVVVARDSVVQLLKNKSPKYNELERIGAIQKFLPEAKVVLGDTEQGSYDVVKKHQPDMICLGYDQRALAEDLQAKLPHGIRYHFLPKL